MKDEVQLADFERLDIRVGTVLVARLNPKALKPAYILDIDFGTAIGVRRSSAQLTEAYDVESLIGRQVAAILNFPPRRIAGILSQVLVLAAVQDDGPTIVLTPASPVADGSNIA